MFSEDTTDTLFNTTKAIKQLIKAVAEVNLTEKQLVDKLPFGRRSSEAIPKGIQ